MAPNGIQDSYRGDKEESESAESGDLETLQKVEHMTFRRKKNTCKIIKGKAIELSGLMVYKFKIYLWLHDVLYFTKRLRTFSINISNSLLKKKKNQEYHINVKNTMASHT